jgi:branched-chain amino acid transport system ATP-binding protein
MAMLEVNNISKAFGGVRALENFSVQVDAGEIHGIIGPNGAGKTTALNVISGIYDTDSGEIILDGNRIETLPQYKRTRQGLGRTFQNIRLFKGLSVEENVMCGYDHHSYYTVFDGLFPSPRRFRDEKKASEMARHYLDLVGVLSYAEERPDNLSYGIQRRIEIARALTCTPKILLLDEPAAGLNPTEVTELTELINRLAKELNIGIIVIEHRLELIMSISDRVHVLNFGKPIASGTPEEVQNNQEVIDAYLGVEED